MPPRARALAEAEALRLRENMDLAELRRIHRLVKEEGFTLQGAREKLRDHDDGSAGEPGLREHLMRIRKGLLDLRERLERQG
jgi:DNA-binding transcriptional MerR regulator